MTSMRASKTVSRCFGGTGGSCSTITDGSTNYKSEAGKGTLLVIWMMKFDLSLRSSMQPLFSAPNPGFSRWHWLEMNIAYIIFLNNKGNPEETSGEHAKSIQKGPKVEIWTQDLLDVRQQRRMRTWSRCLQLCLNERQLCLNERHILGSIHIHGEARVLYHLLFQQICAV